jgi:hypothetical protein
VPVSSEGFPGKSDLDRNVPASVQEGDRKADHEASRRRAGMTREAVWPGHPGGRVVVVLIEADAIGAALWLLRRSRSTSASGST